MRRGGFASVPVFGQPAIRQLALDRISGWSTYIPNDQAIAVVGANLEITAGTVAAGHGTSPNRTAGAWAYQTVLGDFDIRARVNPRNSDGTALSTTTGTKDFALHCGANVSGATDWLYQASRRVNTTVSAAFQHANAAGTVAGPAAQATASNNLDLRLVRRGQQFRGFYRETSASVPLQEDDGWTLHNTLSKANDPMPDACFVGPMIRVSGTGATNALHRVELWMRDGVSVHP